MQLHPRDIKEFGDFQINWSSVIPPLRPGRFMVEKVSMHGDAPKDFIRIKEYVPGRANIKVRHWTAYIAKVGSKRYPIESVTEQLFTRIGQAFDLNIADSKLLVVAGQVRFLSKYFLNTEKESLVHGLEIFRRCLDDQMVAEIAEGKRERDFYTFQTVLTALQHIYPEHWNEIAFGLVDMLAFDAIAGNNDRHPLNWGIIAPLTTKRPITFAPIFDTARGMFWNTNDSKLDGFINDPIRLEKYMDRAFPQISWDGIYQINHFDLIAHIYCEYPEYRDRLATFCRQEPIEDCVRLIDEEFKELMSQRRRIIIKRCLRRRHERYCDALD